MSKTKLGISVGLLAAITYFCGLFSGLLATVVVAGYILIAEEDAWLRKAAVRAVVLLVAFHLVYFAIGLIPDGFAFLAQLVRLFSAEAAYAISSNSFITGLDNFIGIIISVLSFVQDIVFILLGLAAFSNKEIKIPVVDSVSEK